MPLPVTTSFAPTSQGGTGSLPICTVLADHSRGPCETCLHEGQCMDGYFCCPKMKKCVSSSSMSCSSPTAGSHPTRCPSSKCNMNGCDCDQCSYAGPGKLNNPSSGYEWVVWANLENSNAGQETVV